VLASVGDERNALLMLTVEADFGGGKVALPAARLYLFDDEDKIKAEQIVFFAAPS
jgi:hypothetical protein